MQAAPSAAIAERFPLLVRHVCKGGGFPKRRRGLACHCTMLKKVARERLNTKDFCKRGHQKKRSLACLFAPSSCAVAIQLCCNVLIGRDNGKSRRGGSKNPCRRGRLAECIKKGSAMQRPALGSASARVSVYRRCSARRVKTSSKSMAVISRLVDAMSRPLTSAVCAGVPSRK